MPGRHRAPLASPAAQASRARRAGGSPGTATMSHRDGQDRHDVTSLRLAAPSPVPPRRGGRGRGEGLAGREGCARSRRQARPGARRPATDSRRATPRGFHVVRTKRAAAAGRISGATGAIECIRAVRTCQNSTDCTAIPAITPRLCSLRRWRVLADGVDRPSLRAQRRPEPVRAAPAEVQLAVAVRAIHRADGGSAPVARLVGLRLASHTLHSAHRPGWVGPYYQVCSLARTSISLTATRRSRVTM